MTSKTSSNTTNTKVIYFGNEELATGIHPEQATILEGLINGGYNVTALILNKSTREKRTFAVEASAKSHGIPIFTPASRQELTEIIGELPADIGVLAAYGRIVRQEVINHFRYGILNVHPSLLPLYRGSAPIEQAILDGANQTGVSIMQLEAGLDSGPILTQASLPLTGRESKAELTHQLTVIGSKLLIEVLPKVLGGTASPTPQDETRVTHTSLITKQAGRLRTEAHSATVLERQIRAFAGWPTSYIEINGTVITILKAKISQEKAPIGKLSLHDKQLLLGCKGGSLGIVQIQPAGKKPMDARGFINGYGKLLS